MKVQNLARSKQSAKDFFESVVEPVEAVVGGHSFIVWPTETLEFFARALADKKVQEGLMEALGDVKNAKYVEFDPNGPSHARRRGHASRKRSKP